MFCFIYHSKNTYPPPRLGADGVCKPTPRRGNHLGLYHFYLLYLPTLLLIKGPDKSHPRRGAPHPGGTPTALPEGPRRPLGSPFFSRSILDRFLAPLGAHLGPNLAPKTAPDRRKIDQKWHPDSRSILASIFHRMFIEFRSPNRRPEF